MSLTSNQKKLLVSLKKVGRDISSEKGRALTPLVGEFSACDKLNMKWGPSEGYDCIDSKGKKVEIKSRRDSKGEKVDPQGRLGKFGRKGKYGFYYGLYVELDSKFDVVAIYKASKKTIKELEEKEKGNRGLHISTLRKKAKIVYP